MIDAAFLSLAKRLGNPIAELPDAIGTLELVNLTRACQASTLRERLLQATAARLQWLARFEAGGAGQRVTG
jgi:hypothetical protein